MKERSKWSHERQNPHTLPSVRTFTIVSSKTRFSMYLQDNSNKKTLIGGQPKEFKNYTLNPVFWNILVFDPFSSLLDRSLMISILQKEGSSHRITNIQLCFFLCFDHIQILVEYILVRDEWSLCHAYSSVFNEIHLKIKWSWFPRIFNRFKAILYKYTEANVDSKDSLISLFSPSCTEEESSTSRTTPFTTRTALTSLRTTRYGIENEIRVSNALSVQPYLESVVIPDGLLRDRTKALARDIYTDNKDKELLLICILKVWTTAWDHRVGRILLLQSGLWEPHRARLQVLFRICEGQELFRNQFHRIPYVPLSVSHWSSGDQRSQLWQTQGQGRPDRWRSHWYGYYHDQAHPLFEGRWRQLRPGMLLALSSIRCKGRCPCWEAYKAFLWFPSWLLWFFDSWQIHRIRLLLSE